MFGAGGNDTIHGYNGADTIHGGDGNDRLKGGLGKDNFVFDTTPNASTNVDRLDDFKHGEDHVWLSGRLHELSRAADGTDLDPANFVVGTGTPGADTYLSTTRRTHQLYL